MAYHDVGTIAVIVWFVLVIIFSIRIWEEIDKRDRKL